jgi:hypothetical protein
MKKTITDIFGSNIKITSKQEYEKVTAAFKQLGYNNTITYYQSGNFHIFGPSNFWLKNNEINITNGKLTGCTKECTVQDVLALAQSNEQIVKVDKVLVDKQFVFDAYEAAPNKHVKEFIEKAVKGQSPLAKEFEVSAMLIKQGYELACKEWKEKLEKKFPDLFGLSCPVEKLIKEMGGVYGYMPVYNDDHVFVPLPTANHEWSVAAFEWAIKFVENARKQNVHSYICHGYRSVKPNWKSDTFDNYITIRIA